MVARFRSIKEEVRIIGFDDGPFKRADAETLVVGAVFRGGLWMDGVLSTRVRVDGLDSTEKLIALVNGCRFKDGRVLMLDGIAFGGFNVVDIKELSLGTGLPVIAVTRDEPDFASIEAALSHLPDGAERLRTIRKAGEPTPVETQPGKNVLIQHAGIGLGDAERIVKLSATRSLIPEPLRVAHLIARGIVLGESRGMA